MTDDCNFLDDWSLGEEEKRREGDNNRAIKIYRRNISIHLKMADNLHDLCPPPAKGEQWRIVTEYRFNAFSLILETLKIRDIEELYVAIYRINEPTVRAITNMISDGKIRKANFIISDFFRENKKAEIWANNLAQFCKKNSRCKFAYAHNHAKVTLIRDTEGNTFVFEGSGNMSDNARIEQYTYENIQETFDFHRNWMEKVINERQNP